MLLIIVVYVIARLLQVPIEQSNSANKEWFLWTISLLAILFVVWITFVTYREVGGLSNLPFGKS